MTFEPLEITLNRKEVTEAVASGTKAHIDSVAARLAERREPFIHSWDNDINQALAQAAVTKWLNGRKGPIARAASKDYGNLIISDKDNPSDTYVLVSCLTPVFRIEGFIRVSDAQEIPNCQAQTQAGRRWWINKKHLRDPREMGGR